MESSFWNERWRKNTIGFHQGSVNPWLERYYSELKLSEGEGVFVPLCGKSLDMLWLAEQGHPVVGVEFSKIAVQAFFEENGLYGQEQEDRRFLKMKGDSVTLLAGDFFDVERTDLAGIQAVYDRAALIALPPDLRQQYTRRLTELMEPGTKMLLITIEYPQEDMQGPPFSVPEHEVRALYESDFSIRLLAREDVMEENERFRERGLSELDEVVYLLERKSLQQVLITPL